MTDREEDAPEEEWRDAEPGGSVDLALGYLAAAPLAIAYEWAVASGGGTVRNTAERIVSTPVAWLADGGDLVRRLAMLAGLLAALVLARRAAHLAGEHLPPRVLRVPLEGLLAALALGPALVWAQRVLGAADVPLGLDRVLHATSPSLEVGALVAGGAFYEELVFRVGALGLAYLGWRHTAAFLGAPGRLARVVGDVGGVATAALVFAAFHLDALSRLAGVEGEAFDGATFSWRFLGGCLLGLLLRWRGFGVAAWCHGLFNLALLLGAGPGVLR